MSRDSDFGDDGAANEDLSLRQPVASFSMQTGEVSSRRLFFGATRSGVEGPRSMPPITEHSESCDGTLVLGQAIHVKAEAIEELCMRLRTLCAIIIALRVRCTDRHG